MEPREIVSFVKMIKSFPALYNSTLPEYCDKELTDCQWKSVARAHKITVSQAKEKWRNIRNGFARSLRPFPDTNKPRKPYYLSKEINFLIPFLKAQGITKNISDDDNDLPEENEDQDEIYFEEVSDEVKVKRRESSEEPDSPENSKDNLLSPYAEENAQKRSKRNYSNHWNEPETEISVEHTPSYEQYEPSHSKRAKMTNHREMFLLSLVPELDKLSDEQMLSFKVKVLTMLSMMLSNDTLAVDNTV